MTNGHNRPFRNPITHIRPRIEIDDHNHLYIQRDLLSCPAVPGQSNSTDRQLWQAALINMKWNKYAEVTNVRFFHVAGGLPFHIGLQLEKFKLI